MTQEEFNASEKEILQELPEAFRSFVSSYAWDKGHCYGFEEVLSYERDLVSRLREAIANYLFAISNPIR
jgi:hypothetical protein